MCRVDEDGQILKGHTQGKLSRVETQQVYSALWFFTSSWYHLSY